MKYKMRKREQEHKEQERPRRYYFFDYLFWLGEITWVHYHDYDVKQPNGNAMLQACVMFFIFIPTLTITGHFLHDYDRLIYEFSLFVLTIVGIVAVIVSDWLFGKIYPPSRRKAVMRHYEGRKFSRARSYFFFFSFYLLLVPEMVLWGTMLRWISETIK